MRTDLPSFAVLIDTAKIGHNDTCYCGRGRKYKKCHGFSA